MNDFGIVRDFTSDFRLNGVYPHCAVRARFLHQRRQNACTWSSCSVLKDSWFGQQRSTKRFSHAHFIGLTSIEVWIIYAEKFLCKNTVYLLEQWGGFSRNKFAILQTPRKAVICQRHIIKRGFPKIFITYALK